MDEQRREQRYRSYLLRLYRVRKGKERWWRASLQPPAGGEQIHFRTLSELVAFLEQEDPGMGVPGCGEDG